MSTAQFWSDVTSTIIGAGVGAFLAFELERRRRNAEQHRQEVGRCHQMLCLLVNRLNVLQDFNDFLFLTFEREHGQAPRWDQVGALDGAPEHTDDIPIGDYTFLVDGREHQSDAPGLLRKIQLSTINTNSLFMLIAQRNRLWHQRDELRMPLILQRGEEGAAAMGRMIGIERSIQELTTWIQQSLREEIETLGDIFELSYKVMRDRFPSDKLLQFRPQAGGPALGEAKEAD